MCVRVLVCVQVCYVNVNPPFLDGTPFTATNDNDKFGRYQPLATKRRGRPAAVHGAGGSCCARVPRATPCTGTTGHPFMSPPHYQNYASPCNTLGDKITHPPSDDIPKAGFLDDREGGRTEYDKSDAYVQPSRRDLSFQSHHRNIYFQSHHFRLRVPPPRHAYRGASQGVCYLKCYTRYLLLKVSLLYRYFFPFQGPRGIHRWYVGQVIHR